MNKMALIIINLNLRGIVLLYAAMFSHDREYLFNITKWRCRHRFVDFTI